MSIKILCMCWKEISSQDYDKETEFRNKSMCDKHKNKLMISKAIKLIEYYTQDKLKITTDKLIKEKLEDEIYKEYIIREEEEKYDINDDKVNGMTGDVIKTPEYKEIIIPEKNKLKVEFAIFNEKYKDAILYEHRSKFEIPYLLSLVLIIFKYLHYNLGILPLEYYRKIKRN